MATGIGTGTTITFGTSAFSADILDVSGPNLQRGSVDLSHMGTTTARTFVPTDLYDGGEVTFDILFDPADALPPINGDAETITIDPAGVGATDTLQFSGFMTGFEYGFPFEDRMTASVTVKVAGAVAKA